MRIALGLLVLALTAAGCEDHLVPCPGSDVPVTLSLQPAVSLGYPVTRVAVTIDSVSVNLVIAGSEACGTLPGIGPGERSASVEVWSGDHLLAAGTGQINGTRYEPDAVEISCVDWTSLFPALPHRLLFIGNSHTNRNGGIDQSVAFLAASVDPNLRVHAERIAQGSAHLWDHYGNEETLETIRAGEWDVVVLRGSGYTALVDTVYFNPHVRLFAELVAEAGARLALVIPWTGADYGHLADDISRNVSRIGSEVGAIVLPLATTWITARQQCADINLYEADEGHPSPHGTYLSACTIFSILYEMSPIGATFVTDPAITESERRCLQEVGWETAR